MTVDVSPTRPRDSRSTSFSDWLSASRQGSSTDLGQLLEWSRTYLLIVAERELGSTLRPKAGASDLVQESLLEAREAFEQFHGTTREEFLAWLGVILRRNLIDLARRYRTTESRSISREEQEPIFEMLLGNLGSPIDQASLNEELVGLNRAIGMLSEEARAVIRLRHEDQLGWEEIGHRLRKSGEAVRKIWFRAVERLRGELNGIDDGRA